MSLKNPAELFEQRRNKSLADQLAQKKLQEELKFLNKKIISPKELFGVDEEVEEEIIEEVEEEILIDPYLEEIGLLKNDLEKVFRSIPEETDLTKVFQDIRILRNRIDNIPNQKDYSGDIESIREELVRIEGSIPVPEVFDPSDLYENISALKTKLEEVRSEIPTIPEPILYDYQLDQLKEMVVDVRNSIPVVPEIRYYEDDLNEIINAIEEVRSEIPELPEIKYYDDEISIIENRLIEIQNSIPTVPEVKYYDKDVKNLKEDITSVKNSIPEVKYYDKDVKELKEQIKSVKNSIPEVKYYDEDVKELKEEIASVKGSIPEVKYYDEEVKDLYKKVSEIKIPDQEKYLKEVKEIYSTFEKKNHKLLEKVKYLEEVFEKFNEETLTEGLLNEPPDVKNSDPLTPLDQNFVTLDQLKEHYRLFISRIQQQLSTLGGGGETRLEFLDDIDRNSAKVNGRFLKYDAASKKWIGAIGGGGGSQTLDDTLQLGNTSTLGMSVGVITATSFFGDGSGLTNLPGGGESYWVKTSAGINTLSNVGVGTTNPKAKLHSYGYSTVGVGSTEIFGSPVNTLIEVEDGYPWSIAFRRTDLGSKYDVAEYIGSDGTFYFASGDGVSYTSWYNNLGISTNNFEVYTNNSVSFRVDSNANSLVYNNLLVGTTTLTGTEVQNLQVNGGAYISGYTGIGITNPTERLSVAGNISINETTTQGSFTAITATTSAVGIHSELSTSVYRSVEYTIQATQGTNFLATKILTIHNGTLAYNSEYGTIYNNSLVASFNVDVSGGNIRLLAIPASASTTNYTINFVATKI